MGGAGAEASPTEANRQNGKDREKESRRKREWVKEREKKEKEGKQEATKGGGAVKSSVQSPGSDESSARGRSQQLCGGCCVWEQVVVGGQWNVRRLDHLP